MPGSARERLIGMEQYNSRSFHLITEEAIEAVEAEAVAAERARLRALVEGLPGYLDPRYSGQYEVKGLLLRTAVLAELEGPDAR